MATWKAGNYQNSGMSKSQYLAKQSKKTTKDIKANLNYEI
jgi:hypothetical protein